MTPPRAPASARDAAPRRRGAGDEGSTLVEMLMAIMIIGTVMTSAAPFLVSSLTVSNQQRGEQAAIQLATDGLERVRALDPTSLTTGRGKQESQRQWDDAPQKVKDLLGDLQLASDPMLPDASTAGEKAPLPTKQLAVALNGVSYSQQWYVGRCWQVKVDAADAVVGSCKAENLNAATSAGKLPVPYLRAIVAVSWKHSSCPADGCLYVASSLVSVGTDPVFDTKRPAPTVVDPVTQNSYVGTAVDLQVLSTGGRLPLTWTVTGLPPGLTMSSSGQITGVPTTAGTYPVTVKVTDKDNRTDDSTFSWSVVANLTLTNPGAQTTRPNTAVNLALAAAGGRLPRTWSATGLPPGLTINPSTGVISGTTTNVAQALTTVVTVTDSGAPARNAVVSFSWRITPLTLFNPGPQTATNGTTVSYPLSASGGTLPYTWTAANLPAGLSIDAATGRVTGTIQDGTRYLISVTVTDKMGATASMDVICIINPSTTSDLRITSPGTASPNRNDPMGIPVSFTATAGGANYPGFTWTATDLPPGMSISPAGVVSGTPTTRGNYRVRLTVTNNSGPAYLMFDWSVT